MAATVDHSAGRNSGSLERIEFDFDDNGGPELPSMISDRDISKVVP